ncbi:hypothetical protein BV20DRAFT_1041829 [Pilatotrama ljubarskyi]|nr:hypothetical protein BV20DRAFT_1041829 [Pilatotrama ljubarskyi]
MPTREQFLSAIAEFEDQAASETIRCALNFAASPSDSSARPTQRLRGTPSMLSHPAASIHEIHQLLKSSTLFTLRLKNSRRPVNRVPPEILRIIFLQCPQTTDFGRLTLHQIQDLGWPLSHLQVSDVLKLSHVCRHWRTVVHELPNLWTSIRDVHVEETRAFLSRAKDFPLNVLICANRSAWFWDICADRGSLIRELHWMSAVCNGADSDDFAALDINAPNVERLSLSRGTGALPTNRRASILKGATSKVAFLSLNGLKWAPSNSFPALTHLVLSGPQSLSDILRLLSNCPSLRSAVLRKCDHSLTPHTPIASPPVQLPTLRRLSLDVYPYEPLQEFMSLLEFDYTKVALEVVVRELSPVFSDELEVPYSLNNVIAPSGYTPQPLTRLRFEQVSSTRKASAVLALSETGGIRFRVAAPLSYTCCSNMIRENIALEHITDLEIEDIDEAAFMLFVTMRPNMPALRTLTLLHPEHAAKASKCVSMCVHTLQLLPSLLRDRCSETLPIPTLRIMFADGKDVSEDQGKRDIFRALSDWGGLHARKNRLVMQAPEFPPRYYAKLLPELEKSWDPVVTVVASGGTRGRGDMPAVTEAEEGFPAWEGW